MSTTNNSQPNAGNNDLSNLPKIIVTREQMEGTPVIADRDTAVTIFRSCFTPEVWVQMHLFAMYSDYWDNLIGIRQLNVGTGRRVEADIKLLMRIAIETGATHVSLCLTRTSWNTDSSISTDNFMKVLAEDLHKHDMSLEWFFIMSQNHEEDIASELSIKEILGHDAKNIFILE